MLTAPIFSSLFADAVVAAFPARSAPCGSASCRDGLMVGGRPTYLWAAELVLRKQGTPLRARQIVDHAQAMGLFSDEMHSKTPQKSLQARLSLDILLKENRSAFVRTERGLFFLRELLIEQPDTEAGQSRDLAMRSPYTARRRAPAPATERVLAIPRSHFERHLTFQGFREDDGTLIQTLVTGPAIHIPRTDAEDMDDHKQVVTYVLVTHGAKVLSFRRGTFNRAAAFLRGSLCIGFGGHVADSDLTIFSAKDAGILANAVRELGEEVVLAESARPRPDDIKVVGVINDDSSEVGRRHVGVVLRYEVRDADWQAWASAQRGEASINQLRWIDAFRESTDLAEFEHWSQLCWRSLFPIVARAQPAYRVLRRKPFVGPHILVVVGGIGSGKSSATRYLTRNFGYVEVNSGRVVANILGLPPVPETPRLAFQDAAWRLVMDPAGPSRIADALLTAAAGTGAKRVVIDGVRQSSTLQALSNRAGVPVAVLYVHAAPDVAFELHARRGRRRNEAALDPGAFMRMLSAPVERDVPFMISEADAVLYNWAGEDGYGKALSAMAEDLGLKRADGSRR